MFYQKTKILRPKGVEPPTLRSGVSRNAIMLQPLTFINRGRFTTDIYHWIFYYTNLMFKNRSLIKILLKYKNSSTLKNQRSKDDSLYSNQESQNVILEIFNFENFYNNFKLSYKILNENLLIKNLNIFLEILKYKDIKYIDSFKYNSIPLILVQLIDKIYKLPIRLLSLNIINKLIKLNNPNYRHLLIGQNILNALFDILDEDLVFIYVLKILYNLSKYSNEIKNYVYKKIDMNKIFLKMIVKIETNDLKYYQKYIKIMITNNQSDIINFLNNLSILIDNIPFDKLSKFNNLFLIITKFTETNRFWELMEKNNLIQKFLNIISYYNEQDLVIIIVSLLSEYFLNKKDVDVNVNIFLKILNESDNNIVQMSIFYLFSNLIISRPHIIDYLIEIGFINSINNKLQFTNIGLKVEICYCLSNIILNCSNDLKLKFLNFMEIICDIAQVQDNPYNYVLFDAILEMINMLYNQTNNNIFVIEQFNNWGGFNLFDSLSSLKYNENKKILIEIKNFINELNMLS